jgi:protein-L-isoaspartate O-methyltransferase
VRAPRSVTEAELDRLAQFEHAVGFDHSVHCYRWLLGRIPSNAARVVEVGCGTGTFTAILARRAGHVLAR